MQKNKALYPLIPSVDALYVALAEQNSTAWLESYPRPLLRHCINEFLDNLRSNIAKETLQKEDLALEKLVPLLTGHITKNASPRLKRMLNATGVIVHTNMGRSLLPEAAVQALIETAPYYSNLEFNTTTGKRGSRYNHVEELLCTLTGAEAALVVNNNAAAVLLVLDTLCKGGEVVVSRGELVEIGGSFRIPAVMERGGCTLCEVGTTNKTHFADYAEAITEKTTGILKVHTSNYRITGFSSSVSLEELLPLAENTGLPLIEDLGSGSLCDFTREGIPFLGDEPTVQQEVAAGAHIVTFSGDKVLGGPQAGIIVGRKKYIDQLKKNHLTRALRIDKLTLTALEATLRLYLEPAKAIKEIPTLRMLFMSAKELRNAAGKLSRAISLLCKDCEGLDISIVPGVSRTGGGAFPEKSLPTHLVRLSHTTVSAEELRKRLLDLPLPLVGRIENNAFCLDPRTLLPKEYPLVAEALALALKK